MLVVDLVSSWCKLFQEENHLIVSYLVGLWLLLLLLLRCRRAARSSRRRGPHRACGQSPVSPHSIRIVPADWTAPYLFVKDTLLPSGGVAYGCYRFVP